MKKAKKKTVRMAMVGGVIGIMMNIVFSKSPNVIAVIPLAIAIGSLIGYLMDKR